MNDEDKEFVKVAAKMAAVACALIGATAGLVVLMMLAARWVQNVKEWLFP